MAPLSLLLLLLACPAEDKEATILTLLNRRKPSPDLRVRYPVYSTFDLSTLRPCDLATLRPCDLATLRPCDLATLRPCDLATLRPCDLRPFDQRPFDQTLSLRELKSLPFFCAGSGEFHLPAVQIL
jgi:hypothetical protein